MSNKNNTSNSKMAVPEAKEAMDKFQMEIANELGVPLTNGYNGNLTFLPERQRRRLYGKKDDRGAGKGDGRQIKPD